MPRIDVLKCLFLREALGFGGVSQLGTRELHQIGGIALIHDGEVFRQSGRLPVAKEPPVRRRVERSTDHPLAVAAHESLGPRQHLLGRPARERQQQYALRRHATLDQVRYTIYERPGLPGAGAGDDEKRTIPVRCSGRLLRIQLRCKVTQGALRLGTRSRRINLERVRHATISRSVEREVTTAVRSNASANFAVARSRTSWIEISSKPSSRAIDVMTT